MIRLLLVAFAAVLALPGVAEAAPTIVTPPVISGEPVIGARLATDGISVDEASPLDVSLTWERSGDGGFAPIDDAHDGAYTPIAADVGLRLRVHAVVETADGRDEAWSDPTVAVGYPVGAERGALRIGPEAGAPVRFDRWRVVAGGAMHLVGVLDPSLAAADARLLLEPTVPRFPTVEEPVAIDARGGVEGVVRPLVNAIAWLEVTPAGGVPERIRLGAVGVRPRIVLLLAARADGRDGAGRPLVRDLRVLPGSVIAPGITGLRLRWEGRLPGESTGTAVCRSSERIVSIAGGLLRGGCGTRGAWRAARWRLVSESTSGDPGATPFLPAASAWVTPRVGARHPAQVPVLPRSSARLRPWN
ncbi:MAG: hypothetical protein ACR2JV_07795 [Gaiellales bacterium]